MTEAHRRKFCVVEAKKFEFVLINRGVEYLRVVERGRGLTKGVVLGKATARWLDAALDEALIANNKTYFIKSFRDGDKVFVIQRLGNAKGRFLSLSVLGVGRRLGLIIIPEGRHGKGWYDFNNTLGDELFPVLQLPPEFTSVPLAKKEAWKTPKQWAQVFAEDAKPEKTKLVVEAAVDSKVGDPRRDSREEDYSQDQGTAKISAKDLAGVKWDDLEREKGTKKTKLKVSLFITVNGSGKRSAKWSRVADKLHWVPKDKGKGPFNTIELKGGSCVEMGESSSGPIISPVNIDGAEGADGFLGHSTISVGNGFGLSGKDVHIEKGMGDPITEIEDGLKELGQVSNATPFISIYERDKMMQFCIAERLW